MIIPKDHLFFLATNAAIWGGAFLAPSQPRFSAAI